MQSIFEMIIYRIIFNDTFLASFHKEWRSPWANFGIWLKSSLVMVVRSQYQLCRYKRLMSNTSNVASQSGNIANRFGLWSLSGSSSNSAGSDSIYICVCVWKIPGRERRSCLQASLLIRSFNLRCRIASGLHAYTMGLLIYTPSDIPMGIPRALRKVASLQIVSTDHSPK